MKKNKNTSVYEDCLLDSEISIVNKIFNSLKIDNKKSVFVKNINLNDNVYKLFFDKFSKNYFWKSTTENYNEIDNNYLNFKYNHQPEVIYFAKDFSNEPGAKRFYNKFVKIGQKMVMVTVAASLILSSLTGCSVKNENPEVKETTTIAMETTTEKEDIPWYWHEEVVYNWDDLKQIIFDNNNLSQEDKELIYKMKFVFDENHQYMDLQMVYHNLSVLSIEHNASGVGEAFGVGGRYDRYTNQIKIYREKLETVVHEFLHALQLPSNGSGKELSNEFFTREILTRLYRENLLEKEQFLNEYALESYNNGEFNIDTEENFLYRANLGTGYDEYVDVFYILANMLPQEIMRTYQFAPTDDVIADALDNMTGIGKGYELMDLIRNLYADDTYAYSQTAAKCYELLNTYHKAIKGFGVENDSTLSMLMIRSGNGQYIDSKMWDYMENKHNINFSYCWEEVFPKTYLSNIQEDTILLYGSGDSEPKIFKITDSISKKFYDYSLESGRSLS